MRYISSVFPCFARRWPHFASAALAVALLAFTSAHAEEKAAVKPDPADLKRIEEYLNSLSTIVADFTQVAPDGTLTGGKFFLKRPGKMRWQYDPPTPLLMIANGRELVYYDYELQQVSNIPIDSTLASFLAKDNISLTDETITVERLEKLPGVLRLTIKQKDKEKDGALLLELADNPLQIKNMVVTDSQNQVTTVSLNNAQFGPPIENKMFVFQDPRKRKKT